MDTKLIAAAAVLFLAGPAALASDYHREALGPTTVNAQAVAAAGISLCDNTVGSINPAFLCGQGGVGAIIALDGSTGEKDLNPAAKVSGTCNVALAAAVGGLSGDFSYSCGVDRDDDGFVTNFDATTADSRGFDDDSTGNVAKGVTASVCFREDLDGAFDDMAIFIATNAPSTSASAGTFDIDVNLAADTGCTPNGFEGGATGGGSGPPTGVCSQTYDHGTITTQPCPPDLCGLNQGFAAVAAQGPAGGSAPIGTLVCHDANHQVTGSMSTAPGSFNAQGSWQTIVFGPIVGGTHPHCLLTSIGDADYAVVQCGKV
jgi:hypothetical protein